MVLAYKWEFVRIKYEIMIHDLVFSQYIHKHDI